jgi:hypothetical protein
MLAKNLAEQLKKKLKEDGKLEDYGQTLQFKKICMAQPGSIIVEEFVEGEFVNFSITQELFVVMTRSYARKLRA